MFGMGFTEILFVAIIAIIFLGPDKLPEAMVQIAKFFNSFKKTVSEAKSTFEQEIHINDLKQEALSYKRQIDSDISGFKNSMSNPIDDLNEALADLDKDKPDDKPLDASYKNSQQATELANPDSKSKESKKKKKKKAKQEDKEPKEKTQEQA